jgi:hypothetical protein
MQLGVQFRAQVPANSTSVWFTHSWSAANNVVWTVVPTGPVQDAAAQIDYDVNVERQTADLLKYYIQVRNLTAAPVDIEARYAILS